MRRETRSVYQLTSAAAIAAVYVALTLMFLPIAYGPISFRISELLCILPYFTPAAVPGLTVGCLLANFLAGGAPMDVVFGSLATLAGAWGPYRLRRHRWLVWLPPVMANTLVIPWVLRFAYGNDEFMPVLTATIFLSEAIAVGLLGNALMLALEKYKRQIFRGSLAR